MGLRERAAALIAVVAADLAWLALQPVLVGPVRWVPPVVALGAHAALVSAERRWPLHWPTYDKDSDPEEGNTQKLPHQQIVTPLWERATLLKCGEVRWPAAVHRPATFRIRATRVPPAPEPRPVTCGGGVFYMLHVPGGSATVRRASGGQRRRRLGPLPFDTHAVSVGRTVQDQR